jgi:uncharacterized membrane protein YqjE
MGDNEMLATLGILLFVPVACIAAIFLAYIVLIHLPTIFCLWLLYKLW